MVTVSRQVITNLCNWYPRGSAAQVPDLLRKMAQCTREPLEKVNIIGICGSIREGSLTKKALEIALQGASGGASNIELIDLNEYNLYFCDGLESQSVNAKTKIPNDVAKFRSKVKEAKGIILATPEYHNSFSGVLKNALDLLGFEEMEGKVIGLVAVSGGAVGGVSALNGLREVGRALHTWVIPDQAMVPQAWKNLNESSTVSRLTMVGRQVTKYAQLHNNKHALEFLSLIEKAAENPGGRHDGVGQQP